MNQGIKIGKHTIGDESPCYIIAEIGINHNGDVDLAMRLIEAARTAGCNAVKFQKRTIDVVYSQEELNRPRESPFGTTNGELKRALEFGLKEYARIIDYCGSVGIDFIASCWDEGSVDFIEQFHPPAYKVASASLTDDALLRHTRDQGKPVILSTGMSSLDQIDHAVEVLGKNDLIILHCTSAYPCALEELNLNCIPALRKRYGVPVGYSGHETGLATSVTARALGACIIERHITLDRAMWGSDHAASIEPNGFMRLVKDIRGIEKAMGDGHKRVYQSEVGVMQKLRRVGL